jgi:hypothetical protein
VRAALKISREFMLGHFRNFRINSLIILYRNCTGPMSNAIDFILLMQYYPSSLLNSGKNIHNGILEAYDGIISKLGRKMNAYEPVPHCLVKNIPSMKGAQASGAIVSI